MSGFSQIIGIAFIMTQGKMLWLCMLELLLWISGTLRGAPWQLWSLLLAHWSWDNNLWWSVSVADVLLLRRSLHLQAHAGCHGCMCREILFYIIWNNWYCALHQQHRGHLDQTWFLCSKKCGTELTFFEKAFWKRNRFFFNLGFNHEFVAT